MQRLSLGSLLRLIGVVLALGAIIALCVWLNMPKSLTLLVRDADESQHPVVFEVQFSGLDPAVKSIPIRLFYFPKTPIMGVTEHYWSIIAPASIDTISRTVNVPVVHGRIAWQAPLALFGLSNYRLSGTTVGPDDAPYRFAFRAADDDVSARPADFRFDGPMALWKRGFGGGDDAFTDLPSYADVQREVLGRGLRTVNLRLDLAPYPMVSFRIQPLRKGDGWTNDGYQLLRPNAKYIESLATIRTGDSVPIPFARECAAAPQFVAVEGTPPAWARRPPALWAPVPRAPWDRFRHNPRPSALGVRFVAGKTGRPSFDRAETVLIRASRAGAYRLYAACPNAHYATVGVTWIDVRAAD